MLPGGVGTFSELFTLWCLVAIGDVEKKPIVLIGEIWQELLNRLADHFIFRPKEKQILTPVLDIRQAVETLKFALGLTHGDNIEATSIDR